MCMRAYVRVSMCMCESARCVHVCMHCVHVCMHSGVCESAREFRALWLFTCCFNCAPTVCLPWDHAICHIAIMRYAISRQHASLFLCICVMYTCDNHTHTFVHAKSTLMFLLQHSHMLLEARHYITRSVPCYLNRVVSNSCDAG